MAIFTRFGSEVELLRSQDNEGYCLVRRLSDNAQREWHVSELRADNQDDWLMLYKKDRPRDFEPYDLSDPAHSSQKIR